VASRVGGVPEVVKDGKNGFLVQPENPSAIADRVLMLLEEEDLRRRISVTNREKAQEYSWASVVARLEEIYRSYL
jgi:glycosyltransferase involved in cell wall biosynthesis